jgi:hypothetical protein
MFGRIMFGRIMFGRIMFGRINTLFVFTLLLVVHASSLQPCVRCMHSLMKERPECPADRDQAPGSLPAAEVNVHVHGGDD